MALATELCAAEMDRNSTCAAGIIAVAGPYCFVAFQPPLNSHYQTGLSMSMLILTMLAIRSGVPLEPTLRVRKPINVAGPLSKRSGTLMPMGSSSLSIPIPIPIPARYILSKSASLGYR